MPQRQDWSGAPCPIARTVNIVGDPWAVRIMCEAMMGTSRYDDFRARLGVADNVLSRRLQQLVEAGTLSRASYRGAQRTHYEYVLTPAGADLLPVLNAMAVWGERHTEAPGPQGHLTIVHITCGKPSDRADACAHCGEALSASNTAWHRAWASSEAVPIQQVGDGPS
ncbi:helix-turn-helix domain-containing protein [Streptomyces sp. NBC_00687]|uniref:winged helix-turn-helix transcriptional regulator n=1 Tax=Streptomyces sp. NBC_00687 TaxID=2975807 RepID=UPI0022538611|nr:helix-turn-helix domain-containing protein [Streptomyces sp. NBC_00687]MCX4912003.1 helix-turn-helix transcriptional regulator [Streptomyces sp. NBC_00687]